MTRYHRVIQYIAVIFVCGHAGGLEAACVAAVAEATVPANEFDPSESQLAFQTDWHGRPVMQAGYQPQVGHRDTLSAGMNNFPAPGLDNLRAPVRGSPWPTFGNYQRSLKSLFVMPNEDAMRKCGVTNLVDWDSDEQAVALRVRPLNECVQSQLAQGSAARYMSGNVTSWQNFSQLYGVFEIEGKMPGGKGVWPAFWLLSSKGGWPPEIDVVEQIGNDPARLARDPLSGRSSQVYSYNVIAALDASSGGPVNLGASVRHLPDLTQGFHRYAVNWGSHIISFYFDRRLVGSVATPHELVGKPMYWLAGLAIGGGWAGDPDEPTDAAFLVRGISVWRSCEQSVIAKAPK